MVGPRSTINTEKGKNDKWTVSDLLALVQAKREEDEKLSRLTPSSRARFMGSSTKWEALRDRLAELGVDRESKKVRKRWERLIQDFKKVHDYEIAIPNGLPDYWRLDKCVKQTRGMPNNFTTKVYEAMVSWLPRHKNVQLDPEQIIETKDLETKGMESSVPIATPAPVGSPLAIAVDEPHPPAHEGYRPPTTPDQEATPKEPEWMRDVPDLTIEVPIGGVPTSSRNGTSRNGRRAQTSQASVDNLGSNSTPQSGLRGVMHDYESFGHKCSKKAQADADLRTTMMPKMLESMNLGLEGHKELNNVLIDIKKSEVENTASLLQLRAEEVKSMKELKVEEIATMKEGVIGMNSNMGKITSSMELLVQAIANRPSI